MRLLHRAIPRAPLYPFTSTPESTRSQETRIVRVRTSQQCIAVFHRGVPFPSPESISMYGSLHYTELETDENAFTDASTFSATASVPDGRWICAAGICNVFENKTLQRNRYMPYVIKGVGVFDRLPSLLSFMLLIANNRQPVVNCRVSDDPNAKHKTPATSRVDEIGAQCLIDRPSPHSIQLCDAIAPVLPRILVTTSDATGQHSTPGALETCSNRGIDDMSSKRTSLCSPVLSSHMSGQPVRKRGRPPRSHTQTSHLDIENTTLHLGTPLDTSSYAAKTLKAVPSDSNSSKSLVSERPSSRIHQPSLRKLLSASSDHSRVPLIKRIHHVQLFSPDLQHRILNTSTQLAASSSDDHPIEIENVKNSGDTTEEDTPTPRSRDSGSVYHPDTSPVCSPLRIGGSRRKTNNSASASMGLESTGTSQKRKCYVNGRASVEVRMKSLSLSKRNIVVGDLDELEEEDSFKIE